MKKIFILSALLTFLFSTSFAALTELQKINALITAVETSGVSFIRNGQEHSGFEAAKHLRHKLDSVARSPLAPKKSNWTAMMFIEKIASKSSVSRKDYLIKLTDGSLVKARDWLIEKLKQIETANP